jgi:hypothetical protein
MVKSQTSLAVDNKVWYYDLRVAQARDLYNMNKHTHVCIYTVQYSTEEGGRMRNSVAQ